MNRTTFLLSLCALPAALTSCTTSPEASGNPAWPGLPFKTVRAFVYDCEAEHNNMSFFKKDGSMHQGVINAPGALLSATQVQTLLKAVTTYSPKDKYKACYVPHHAFVFYDDAGRPVAHLEVCFTCRRTKASPAGIAESFDYSILWNLLHELGVPAERGPYFYRELYRRKSAGHAG